MAKRKQEDEAADGGADVAKLAKQYNSDEEGGSSDLVSESSSDEQTITLPSLWTLPEEIRFQILDLVCSWGPPCDDYDSEWDEASEADSASQSKFVAISDLDLDMLQDLVLVSRDFYAFFNPLLWSRICITRPSDLDKLYTVLLSNPSLGSHIRSLHLGPVHGLHEKHWPFRFKDEDEVPWVGDEPTVLFKAGLTQEESHLRPRWCKAAKEFMYDYGSNRCQERAVHEAIETALAAVDVQPTPDTGYCDHNFEFIGLVEWTKRLYFAQGALDLYLCKMRRLDDVYDGLRSENISKSLGHPDSCSNDHCEHYPRLVLQGFDVHKAAAMAETGTEPDLKNLASQEDDLPDHQRLVASSDRQTKADLTQVSAHKGEVEITTSGAEQPRVGQSGSKESNELILTREQIWAHFKRRGAHSNHFEHPLIFARPDLRYLTVTWGNEVYVDPLAASERESYYAGGRSTTGGENAVEEEATSSSLEPTSLSSSPPKPLISDSAPALDSLTLDGILARGHAILAKAQKVQNLSLMGIFHGCLASSNLEELRYLSVGPLVPSNAAAPLFGPQLKLPNVKKLRVCGDHPTPHLARAFEGGQLLPSLEELHWDFGYANVPHAPAEDELYEVLNILREARAPAPPSRQERDRKLAAGKEALELVPQQQCPSRYIEARVHPKYLLALLEMAGSKLRACWTEGLPSSDASHRLRLLKSRAWKDCSGWSPATQKYDVLRRDSHQWWDEIALQLQTYGRKE